jgi:hypothetical protein
VNEWSLGLGFLAPCEPHPSPFSYFSDRVLHPCLGAASPRAPTASPSAGLTGTHHLPGHCLRWGPEAASNFNPPKLCLYTTWDYRCELAHEAYKRNVNQGLAGRLGMVTAAWPPSTDKSI